MELLEPLFWEILDENDMPIAKYAYQVMSVDVTTRKVMTKAEEPLNGPHATHLESWSRRDAEDVGGPHDDRGFGGCESNSEAHVQSRVIHNHSFVLLDDSGHQAQQLAKDPKSTR